MGASIAIAACLGIAIALAAMAFVGAIEGAEKLKNAKRNFGHDR